MTKAPDNDNQTIIVMIMLQMAAVFSVLPTTQNTKQPTANSKQ